MKDIAIYGAGGFGKEVACLIRRINESQAEPVWNFVGFFDDDPEKKGHMISHFGHCLGGIEELNGWPEKIGIAMAVGNPVSVKKIYDRISNAKVEFPNLIHPDFIISDPKSFSIGKGNIIQGSCVATVDVSLGDFNVLNGSVVLGHDDKVGSFNSIMPAVRFSGQVQVGDCNFFGVGSIILQQIKIGNCVRLGAGSVLMTNPKDGFLYAGNPAIKYFNNNN